MKMTRTHLVKNKGFVATYPIPGYENVIRIIFNPAKGKKFFTTGGEAFDFAEYRRKGEESV